MTFECHQCAPFVLAFCTLPNTPKFFMHTRSRAPATSGITPTRTWDSKRPLRYIPFYLPPHSESLHIFPQWVDYAHWPIQKHLLPTCRLSREEFLRGNLLGAVWFSLSHWRTRLRVRGNLVLTVWRRVELCRKALFRISAKNVIQISSAAVLFLVSGDTASRPRWSLLASPRELSDPQVSPFRTRGLACHCCSVCDSVLEILGAQRRVSLVQNTKWSRWKGRTKKSSRVHP